MGATQKFTSRNDFPKNLPDKKTFYCWHCRVPGAEKRGKTHVTYVCPSCKKSSARVLIYDKNMQQHFDREQRLVHESCGVFITRRKDGKILLFKRTKFPFLWTVPAGHLELGETAELCAARETKEEIGVDVPALAEIFEGNIEGDKCQGGADIHHWRAYGCAVDMVGRVKFDGEGLAWDWFAPEDLAVSHIVQPVLHILFQPEAATRLADLRG
jgi:ADP-ribose pyrophosphatase YjhB (NUDIX family)